MSWPQPTEWWKEICICVQVENILFEEIVAHVEERRKRITRTEKLCECCSWVAVELVCEVIATAICFSCEW